MSHNLDQKSSLISQLCMIVGDDHVLFDEADVELISRTSVPERYIPKFAVLPGNAAEVQEVMKAANEHKIPVWPVSQGKNWGYGSKSACYPGGITMVLSRMNRICEVNEELGYAVIEPGVTYGQLNDYLKAHYPSLWADTAGSTTEASVIGNALDRGRGLTPYADHCAALCGMDVILPDGMAMKTGGGSEGDYASHHIYKWGVGPYMDGLFSQSNLGIVVRSGIWLMPAPEKFDFFVFEFTADPSQFADFLTDFRTLLFQGVVKSYPHLANDFAMLCIVDQYPNDLLEPGQTYLSDEAMQIWRKRLGVSEWTFGCGLYGTKGEVRTHKRTIKKALSKYGELVFVGGCEEDTLKARLTLKAAKMVLQLKGKTAQMVEGLPDAINLFKGIPTDYFVRQVYFKSHAKKPPVGAVDPPRDGCGFTWIGPLLPYDPKLILDFLEEIKPLYKEFGFDFFVELMIESPRCMLALFGFFYDKSSEVETERAQALYQAIHDLSYERGYPPYRTTPASSKTVLDHNPPLKDALHKMKQALDVNNILAPGRYGVE